VAAIAAHRVAADICLIIVFPLKTYLP